MEKTNDKKTGWFNTWLRSTPWLVIGVLILLFIINVAAAGSLELNPTGNTVAGLMLFGAGGLAMYKWVIRE